MALARASPQFQALDQNAVELFEDPQSEDPCCHICAGVSDEKDEHGDKSQSLIYLGHVQCSRRAHLQCMLDWLENACFCPFCRGCLKGHKDKAQCRRQVTVQEDVERLDTAAISTVAVFDRSRHWSHISEEPRGTFGQQVDWLETVLLSNLDVFPNAIDSQLQYAVDVQVNARHSRETSTLRGRLNDIPRMNQMVRRDREGWIRRWNDWAARFLSAGPSSLSRSTFWYVWNLSHDRVNLFLALKAREEIADFLYTRTVKRIVKRPEEPESLSLSDEAEIVLSCLFHQEQQRIIPYELSDEVLYREDLVTRQPSVRRARWVWLERRRFATEYFSFRTERCMRPLELTSSISSELDAVNLLPPSITRPAPVIHLFDPESN